MGFAVPLACVTGATGCIGRNIVDDLLQNGWSVIVFHRKSSDLSRLAGCNVRFQEVELTDLESIRKGMPEGVDAIFHVAANLSHWSMPRVVQQQWRDNVLGTRFLVQAALEKKARRFIFTSTWATHRYADTDEVAAERISIPYVRTKRLSELEIYKGMENGLDAVILQPIITFGPYDYNNYSQFFEIMRAGGLMSRYALPGKISFCHAQDVAVAHRHAYERGRRGEHYVLGGTYTTWLECFQKIAKIVGTKPPQHTFPPWILWGFVHASDVVGRLINKEPLLTPETFELIRGEPDVPYPDKLKSKTELGYESRSLEVMLEDAYRWLVREGRLKSL
jgi:dihydroflavonol-4-reductase